MTWMEYTGGQSTFVVLQDHHSIYNDSLTIFLGHNLFVRAYIFGDGGGASISALWLIFKNLCFMGGW